MEDGEAITVSGVVRALGPPVFAPLSGEPCVVHMTHARVWSRLDFAGALVRELTVTGAAAFALDTPEGAIVIDAEHSTVVGSIRHFVPPHHTSMRAFLGAKLEHLLGSTFADHVLVLPGHRVEIRGIAVRERALTAGEHGYRDEADQFKVVGHPQRRLEIIL